MKPQLTLCAVTQKSFSVSLGFPAELSLYRRHSQGHYGATGFPCSKRPKLRLCSTESSSSSGLLFLGAGICSGLLQMSGQSSKDSNNRAPALSQTVSAQKHLQTPSGTLLTALMGLQHPQARRVQLLPSLIPAHQPSAKPGLPVRGANRGCSVVEKGGSATGAAALGKDLSQNLSRELAQLSKGKEATGADSC